MLEPPNGHWKRVPYQSTYVHGPVYMHLFGEVVRHGREWSGSVCFGGPTDRLEVETHELFDSPTDVIGDLCQQLSRCYEALAPHRAEMCIPVAEWESDPFRTDRSHCVRYTSPSGAIILTQRGFGPNWGAAYNLEDGNLFASGGGADSQAAFTQMRRLIAQVTDELTVAVPYLYVKTVDTD